MFTLLFLQLIVGLLMCSNYSRSSVDQANVVLNIIQWIINLILGGLDCQPAVRAFSKCRLDLNSLLDTLPKATSVL